MRRGRLVGPSRGPAPLVLLPPTGFISSDDSSANGAGLKIALGDLKPAGYIKALEGAKLSREMPGALALAATSGFTAAMKDFTPAYRAPSGMTKIQESIPSITAVPGIQEMLARQSESLFSPSTQAMTKMFSEQTMPAMKSVALPTDIAAMLGSIEKHSIRGLTPSVMKDLERFGAAVPIHDVIAVNRTSMSVARLTPSSAHRRTRSTHSSSGSGPTCRTGGMAPTRPCR